MKALGLGISTSVGIGGDPVNGSSFRDHLALFEADPDTDAVVMVGEIGGPQEVEGAEYVRQHMTKPVIAYIAGLSAPKGRKMGHAGAIVSAAGESAQEKIEVLTAAGVTVAANPSCIGDTVAHVLNEHGLLGRSSEVGGSSAVGGSSRPTNRPVDHLKEQPTRVSELLERRRG
jgi:malate-CoA ligase subunit alpha